MSQLFLVKDICDVHVKQQSVKIYELTNTSVTDGTKMCPHGVAEISKNNEVAIKKYILCQAKNENSYKSILYRVNYKQYSDNKDNTKKSCYQFIINLGNEQLMHNKLCLKEKINFNIACKSILVSNLFKNLAISISITLILLAILCSCWKYRQEIKVSFITFGYISFC